MNREIFVDIHAGTLRVSGMKLTPFHETLGQALSAACEYAEAFGAVFNRETICEPFSSGMVYGETREAHAPIETLKGKKTCKYLHVTVWRSESGRYEVNAYVL